MGTPPPSRPPAARPDFSRYLASALYPELTLPDGSPLLCIRTRGGYYLIGPDCPDEGQLVVAVRRQLDNFLDSLDGSDPYVDACRLAAYFGAPHSVWRIGANPENASRDWLLNALRRRIAVCRHAAPERPNNGGEYDAAAEAPALPPSATAAAHAPSGGYAPRHVPTQEEFRAMTRNRANTFRPGVLPLTANQTLAVERSAAARSMFAGNTGGPLTADQQDLLVDIFSAEARRNPAFVKTLTHWRDQIASRKQASVSGAQSMLEQSFTDKDNNEELAAFTGLIKTATQKNRPNLPVSITSPETFDTSQGPLEGATVKSLPTYPGQDFVHGIVNPALDQAGVIGSVFREDGQAVQPFTGIAVSKKEQQDAKFNNLVGAAGALRNVTSFTKPLGKEFKGTLYRFENPARTSTTWDVHKWNIAANHRYSGPGYGATYGSTNAEVALAEVEHYGVASGRVAVAKDVSMNNVLDLTDDNILNQLGVRKEQITEKGDYEITQKIGNWARNEGYDAILAPSAQSNSGSNLIVFPEH